MMYHYNFTNDLRITSLDTSLRETGHAYSTDTVPSASEDKSKNNNMNSLGFFFNLTKTSKCTQLCEKGKTRSVVINFIKKFQYPNTHTNEMFQNAIRDGITLAPMRSVLKLLMIMSMVDNQQAFLTIDEIKYFIFYNSDVAKEKDVNYYNVYQDILKYRETQELPASVEINAENIEWKQETRQIREMMKVLTWSDCVAEDTSEHKFYIHLNDLKTREKSELFDVLNYNMFWVPDTSKSFQMNIESYRRYMDSGIEDSAEDEEDDSGMYEGTGNNILLYGVPGCGKSYKIKHDYCDDENYMERIVFHPDYTNSDFIGQVRPKCINDEVSYEFVPGPFTRILMKAEADEDKTHQYFLIIEEINRGNAPAIFGEVFQLLDRVNGESEYEISNPDIAEKVYGDSNHKVKIPSNVTILATMNTADQNVFTLDTAFKRRWKMQRIKNSFDGCRFEDKKICHDPGITWRIFVETVNKYIVDKVSGNIGSEDKRLGAFFVDEQCLDDTVAFCEKVIMYLWNDAFKYSHEIIFKPDFNSLDDVLDTIYDEGFTKVFNSDFIRDINSRISEEEKADEG